MLSHPYSGRPPQPLLPIVLPPYLLTVNWISWPIYFRPFLTCTSWNHNLFTDFSYLNCGLVHTRCSIKTHVLIKCLLLSSGFFFAHPSFSNHPFPCDQKSLNKRLKQSWRCDTPTDQLPAPLTGLHLRTAGTDQLQRTSLTLKSENWKD